MAFRLMIIMAMGLGALYMMHLLAQDYNKIRQPIGAATRVLTSASASLLQRGKREAIPTAAELRIDSTIRYGQRNRRRLKQQHQQQPSSLKKPVESSSQHERNVTIDWKNILSRDPFECLQSLICQIMAGAEGDSEEAIVLMDFLEASLSMAPAKIGRAFSRGLALRGNTDRCYDEYPFCLYSAKTMLRVLHWFTSSGYEK